MTHAKRLVACALATGLIAGCASGPSADESGRLAWLAGCWESADGANREIWTGLTGGLMFGHAVTFQENGLRHFEQARIDLRPSTAIYYVYPEGQGPIVFVEADPAPNSEDAEETISFINPEHDFPQRISYMRSGRNALSATISKLDGSDATPLSWRKCGR
ncbi:hypothetical protein GC169_02315 [bacterium]|nr:hypothetical protein [bacterium]